MYDLMKRIVERLEDMDNARTYSGMRGALAELTIAIETCMFNSETAEEVANLHAEKAMLKQDIAGMVAEKEEIGTKLGLIFDIQELTSKKAELSKQVGRLKDETAK